MTSDVAGVGAAHGDGLFSEPQTGFDADLGRFHTELLRYVRSRLNDNEIAADLVQESCVRALRYRDSLSGERLRSMLYRIANNLLADHWRRAQTRHTGAHVSLEDQEIADNVPLPEDALAEEERRAALKRVIMSLPPKCRNVFIMARLQGKPHSEIARECGITVSAVEKHLSRALLTCGALVGNKDL